MKAHGKQITRLWVALTTSIVKYTATDSHNSKAAPPRIEAALWFCLSVGAIFKFGGCHTVLPFKGAGEILWTFKAQLSQQSPPSANSLARNMKTWYQIIDETDEI